MRAGSWEWLVAIGALALALGCHCKHAPKGNWDTPPPADAGTNDSSWGP